jgi:nucleoside-diphosphate-sugar epimerase
MGCGEKSCVNFRWANVGSILMKIFLTGATGYIGGSLGLKLIDAGHSVHGLVRSPARAALLEKAGIHPVFGSLEDADIVGKAAREADTVINAANSDHFEVLETLIDALRWTGKTLIHTSGSSVVCDDARGDAASSKAYSDDEPFIPVPHKLARAEINRRVRRAGIELGIRSMVICPTLIYGKGRGLHSESIQIPRLISKSRELGAGVHIGRGLNIWSNVFIDDVVDLFILALDRAPSGSFFFAENGEESFLHIASAISRRLGFGGKTVEWPFDEAAAELGSELARFSFASNSRVKAINARKALGWNPSGPPLAKGIEADL